MKPQSDITVQFGQKVRQFRLSKGLSQENLGELCELDRTYISSLERGHRNVSLKNIAAIAAALKITLTELFEGINIDDQE